jgi:hypothetical protein
MWLWGLSGTAWAVDTTHLDDSPWPGSGVSYATLARAVFAGIGEGGEAAAWVTTRDKVLRQPGTKERAQLPAGSRLTGVEAFSVRSDGQPVLVTLWAFEADTDTPGGGATVAVLFPEGAREPTDVVSVQTDVFCDAREGRTLPLGPDDAFFIRNHHSNSNQSYMLTGLFHVVSGRLRRIAEIFTLDVRTDCAGTFFETLAWTTKPRAGAGYPDVTATVRLSPRNDCPGGRTTVRERRFTAKYRFDAAAGRYVEQGKGLAELDALNERNL